MNISEVRKKDFESFCQNSIKDLMILKEKAIIQIKALEQVVSKSKSLKGSQFKETLNQTVELISAPLVDTK